jgi:transcriptional regulator with XRE-family HTH domain
MTNPGRDPAAASQAHSGQTLQATGIRDVAAAAGVSTATVSRALRGLPRVSPSTRQRILTAAADLGYVASSAASELARARGTRKATHPGQLQRVEPLASKSASCSLAEPSDVSDHPTKPSRGTILVVIGPSTGPGEPDEHQVLMRAPRVPS